MIHFFNPVIGLIDAKNLFDSRLMKLALDKSKLGIRIYIQKIREQKGEEKNKNKKKKSQIPSMN